MNVLNNDFIHNPFILQECIDLEDILNNILNNHLEPLLIPTISNVQRNLHQKLESKIIEFETYPTLIQKEILEKEISYLMTIILHKINNPAMYSPGELLIQIEKIVNNIKKYQTRLDELNNISYVCK
jgi:hypothetical protein